MFSLPLHRSIALGKKKTMLLVEVVGFFWAWKKCSGSLDRFLLLSIVMFNRKKNDFEHIMWKTCVDLTLRLFGPLLCMQTCALRLFGPLFFVCRHSNGDPPLYHHVAVFFQNKKEIEYARHPEIVSCRHEATIKLTTIIFLNIHWFHK